MQKTLATFYVLASLEDYRDLLGNRKAKYSGSADYLFLPLKSVNSYTYIISKMFEKKNYIAQHNFLNNQRESA